MSGAARKLIVSSFVSLDGVVEAPATWAPFDDESKAYALEKLANVELFLLGRATYELFSASWPQINGNAYMDRISGLRKLVASTTLRTVDWNASLLSGDVATELREIKAQPGGDIMKYGVTQLDQTLLSHGLVDEYHLWIMPVHVGRGKRAFDGIDESLLDLSCADTRRFRNGSVILTYVPRSAGA